MNPPALLPFADLLASLSPQSRIATDSRGVKAGDIFIAIEGSAADGHDYISGAIENGASALVVSNPAKLNGLMIDKAIKIYQAKGGAAALTQIAHKLYPSQPEVCLAVTGTNGKSSIVDFTRQLWQAHAMNAASLGTLGLKTTRRTLTIPKDLQKSLTLTTPDSLSLHRALAFAKTGRIHCLALEASSHGLDQGRLNGIKLQGAAFSNLSHDHLDYHKTLENYWQAKKRLFSELLPQGASLVTRRFEKGKGVTKIQLDCYQDLVKIAADRHLALWDYEYLDHDPRDKPPALKARIGVYVKARLDFGYWLVIYYNGETQETTLPLIGEFQLDNAMCALSLSVSMDLPFSSCASNLARLKPVSGRAEAIASTQKGAKIFVDYAHTPNGLETVLQSLLPHLATKSVGRAGKLHLVFGCGGDRDRAKRPLMGEIAQKMVTGSVFITDDNPRGEPPSQIHAEIASTCPAAKIIESRFLAIKAALDIAGPHDFVLIAGKGHEEGQIYDGQTYPFNDADVVRFLLGLAREREIWTGDEIIKLLKACPNAPLQGPITAISFDSRKVKKGDLFIGLTSGARNGGEFALDAIKDGAALAIIDKEAADSLDAVKARLPIMVVDKPDAALETLAAAKRLKMAKRGRKIIGITGSLGKTSVKEAMALALCAYGPTHASKGNFNNHIGLPLSLASLADTSKFGVFELGMNHKGEIDVLAALLKPDLSIITSIAPCHIENFNSLDDIADAKAELMPHTGAALAGHGQIILPRASQHFDQLNGLAKKAGLEIFSFGDHPKSDCQFLGYSKSGKLIYRLDDEEFKINAHNIPPILADNLAAVLLGVKLTTGKIGPAKQALCHLAPAKGRGNVIENAKAGLTIIDESYNASPQSMTAALERLAAFPANQTGRKIAVIGEMRELGPLTDEAHKQIASLAGRLAIDKIYLCGASFAGAKGNIAKEKQGGHYQTAPDLLVSLQDSLQKGDVVLVKASHAVGFEAIIGALSSK